MPNYYFRPTTQTGSRCRANVSAHILREKDRRTIEQRNTMTHKSHFHFERKNLTRLFTNINNFID